MRNRESIWVGRKVYRTDIFGEQGTVTEIRTDWFLVVWPSGSEWHPMDWHTLYLPTA